MQLHIDTTCRPQGLYVTRWQVFIADNDASLEGNNTESRAWHSNVENKLHVLQNDNNTQGINDLCQEPIDGFLSLLTVTTRDSSIEVLSPLTVTTRDS